MTRKTELESNGSEIFIPCSNCFFKFDRSRNRLRQYYNRPSFGEAPQLCGCFEYLSKGFVNAKESTLIAISKNIIQIDIDMYYGKRQS
ncbi:putative transcription initiation factor IIB-like protein [Dirofilaria immitis]